MSRINSRNTKPELVVRKFLHAKGFRFRLHVKKLPGNPDIVLRKYKTAIYVHGCFWHGHINCKYFVVPKTKTDWWLHKINGNQSRDEVAFFLLMQMGWNVIVVWECELKKNTIEGTFANLPNLIRSGK